MNSQQGVNQIKRLLGYAGVPLAVLLVALLVATQDARAQAVKGSLLGTIVDSSGAAAVHATITITETRTNIINTTTTNTSGNYVFSNLQDGMYRVEASGQGSFYGELRVDALNVSNTPNFNNPNGEFGNRLFGQVTTAFGERLVRFGARVTF